MTGLFETVGALKIAAALQPRMRFSLPNWPGEREVGIEQPEPITVTDLIERIGDASALVFFGSSVASTRRRAADVDVLAFVESSVSVKLLSREFTTLTHGYWSSYYERRGALHVTLLTVREFHEALAAGDEVAESVARDGIVLAGNVPFAPRRGARFVRVGTRITVSDPEREANVTTAPVPQRGWLSRLFG